jgi:hypothetical protein
VLEIFGLTLSEIRVKGDTYVSGEEKTKLFVVKDGPNWVQYGPKWATMVGDHCCLTPLVVCCVPRIYVSLVQMHCVEEAAAVKRFFVKERKRDPTSWGDSGLRLLQDWIAQHHFDGKWPS